MSTNYETNFDTDFEYISHPAEYLHVLAFIGCGPLKCETLFYVISCKYNVFIIIII